jgi:hypothetical protein
MLEFRFWSIKIHPVRRFPKALGNLVICYSDFSFQERSSFFTDLREDQLEFRDHGSCLRFAGCFGITMDFFKQPRASVQIEAGGSVKLFAFLWIGSADSGYFLPLYYFDSKSDWLPCSPLLLVVRQRFYRFWYLLFVPIRYHGIRNFSRWNVL